MASGSSLVKKNDEKFFQCSICLEQFKEPKLLPCLHRFCSECLKKVVEKAEGAFLCPECRQECEIPSQGVDGFKIDFYINQIVDSLQLQKSLQDNQIRECLNCSENKTMSAYCFKCNDFLCEECQNHHLTSKMMKDHRSHVLSLEELASPNVGVEKLMSLKDVARCQTHLENVLQLCCSSCGNLPICHACSFGKHRNHDINEVISLASAERDRLVEKLGPIRECKETLDMMRAKVKTIQEQIVINAEEETKKFQSKHEDKMKDNERRKTKLREQIDVKIADIKTNNMKTNTALKESMDKEIQEIKEKYDKLFEKEKRKTEISLKELQENLVDIESQLDGKRAYLDQKSNYILKSIKTKKEKKLKESKQILQHFENTLKRYANLTATADSIISAQNDWTVVNCVSDIIPAIDALIQDVNREFPELDTLEVIDVIDSSLVNLDIAESVNMTEYEEHIIDINGFTSKKSIVTRIADANGENFIIFGSIGKNESFRCLVSIEGTLLSRQVFQEATEEHRRTFTSWSKFKLSVSFKNSTGIIACYTRHNDSYVEKNIKDIVPNWKQEHNIGFIDINPLNNYIYLGDIGKEIKYIFVIDDQLELCHTVKLPSVIKGVLVITCFEDKFLVSELDHYCVHVLSIKGELLHKFQAPVEGRWAPVDMSVDKHGFIYILMGRESPVEGKGKAADYNKGGDDKCIDKAKMIIVQVSQDWSRVLAIRPFDRVALHMAVTETSQGEKLLLATGSSRQIYIFGLEKADLCP